MMMMFNRKRGYASLRRRRGPRPRCHAPSPSSSCWITRPAVDKDGDDDSDDEDADDDDKYDDDKGSL